MLLSCQLIYAQRKEKCRWCKNGIETYTEYISCKNCETWADSYRNIKGCHVCKNNKVIRKIKQRKCIFCKGANWIVARIPAPISKEQQIYNKIRELKLSPTYHIGYFRLDQGEESYAHVMKYRLRYDNTENNLWFWLEKIQENHIEYINVKDKVDTLLDYFGLMYDKSSKSDGWPGCSTFYPSPDEVSQIRSKLNLQASDQNYNPDFGIKYW